MKLFQGDRQVEFCTIVSGLPRSGTSMMMKMLEAGGLTPLTDGEREADTDNPRGYYEYERVKQLPKGDFGWLDEAAGKVVKVVSALLVHLPATHRFRVIFMQRAMPEVLVSQRRMLVHRDEDPTNLSDEQLGAMYEKHLADVRNWMEAQSNIAVLYASFNEMVRDPRPQADRIIEFLGLQLDRAKMIRVVEPALYRQRRES